jgi:hypothetical protein
VKQLKALRWGVRGVLLLGVAASVIANVLHAVDNPISQSIAAWPPLALLLTVELISRIPVHSRALAVARIVATATIAGIAAWVSYWHMVGVAARYGETGASPYLLPASVDGLIVVASICLVELAGRIRATEEPAAPAAQVNGRPAATRVALPGASSTTAVAAMRFDYLRPIGPEPLPEPFMIHFDYDRPIGPMPAPSARTPRRPARSLTAAERVVAAHGKAPTATHEQIAARAKVSVSTVKRYRPAGSPSGPDAAETIKASGSRELVGAAS